MNKLAEQFAIDHPDELYEAVFKVIGCELEYSNQKVSSGPTFYVSKAAQGSDKWKQARMFRVTATRTAKILDEKTRDEVLSEIMGDTVVIANEAMKHGSLNENNARIQHTLDNPGLLRVSLGLCVDSVRSWIAGSPDDIVYDPSTEKFRGVEYKCPFSRGIPKYPYENHILQAKTNMYVTGINTWEIMYWTKKRSESFIVHFDPEEWIEDIEPKLLEFKKTMISKSLKARNMTGKVYSTESSDWEPVYDQFDLFRNLINDKKSLGQINAMSGCENSVDLKSVSTAQQRLSLSRLNLQLKSLEVLVDDYREKTTTEIRSLQDKANELEAELDERCEKFDEAIQEIKEQIKKFANDATE